MGLGSCGYDENGLMGGCNLGESVGKQSVSKQSVNKQSVSR